MGITNREISMKSQEVLAHLEQVKQAVAIEYLVAHVASGGWLEFNHNDGEWKLVCDFGFVEVLISPHRYRVLKAQDEVSQCK